MASGLLCAIVLSGLIGETDESRLAAALHKSSEDEQRILKKLPDEKQ